MIVLSPDSASGRCKDIKVSSSPDAWWIKAPKEMRVSHLFTGTVFSGPRELKMSQRCPAKTLGIGPREASTCLSPPHIVCFQGRLFQFCLHFYFCCAGDKTQGRVLSRQMLYPLTTSLPSTLSFVFQEIFYWNNYRFTCSCKNRPLIYFG